MGKQSEKCIFISQIKLFPFIIRIPFSFFPMNEINYKRTTIRLYGFLSVDLDFDFNAIKDIPVAGPFLSFRS